MNLSLLIKGIASYIPVLTKLFGRSGTSGTDSAMHCYRVWFTHLTRLYNSGLHNIPQSVAELGPGDSIGVGLAALLSGINKNYALDVVKYANPERYLMICDELVELFNRPGRKTSWRMPDFDHYLDGDLFPSHILTEKLLDAVLSQERINGTKNALLGNISGNDKITI
jgi:hypothetical protein